jgi:uncharacterized protein (TIGR02145 family)
MKKAFLLFTAIFITTLATFSQTGSISNVQVEQRADGSGLVDINYDLAGPEDSYFMNIRVSFDAGEIYNPVSFNSLSGDVGEVSPGSRHMVWNPSIDHPNRYSQETKIKLVAYVAGINNPCPGMPTVEDIDGNVYFTVQIGDQCWMASNLNTTKDAGGTVIIRYCYDNDPDNCENYGGLYTWNTIMNGSGSSSNNPSGVQGICPYGWHLPSDAEWTELTDYLTNNYIDINSGNVANKLKSCRQIDSPLSGDCSTSAHPRWDSDNNNYGTNDFGFGALPGGYRSTSNTYYNKGFIAYWWSTTYGLPAGDRWARQMNYNSGSVTRYYENGSFMYSARCLKD